MAWHVVSVPSSAQESLRKNRAGDFSPVQKIGAAVRLYATLPLYQRIRLAQEYLAQCRPERDPSGAPPDGCPSSAASQLGLRPGTKPGCFPR
jgi:hypothetical protein